MGRVELCDDKCATSVGCWASATAAPLFHPFLRQPIFRLPKRRRKFLAPTGIWMVFTSTHGITGPRNFITINKNLTNLLSLYFSPSLSLFLPVGCDHPPLLAVQRRWRRASVVTPSSPRWEGVVFSQLLALLLALCAP